MKEEEVPREALVGRKGDITCVDSMHSKASQAVSWVETVIETLEEKKSALSLGAAAVTFD